MDDATGRGSKAWLSVKEAAEWLSLGRSAVYALVASGQIGCYRMGPNGGRLRFKPSDLEAYAEGTRVGPKEKASAPALRAPRRDRYVPRHPLDDRG